MIVMFNDTKLSPLSPVTPLGCSIQAGRGDFHSRRGDGHAGWAADRRAQRGGV